MPIEAHVIPNYELSLPMSGRDDMGRMFENVELIDLRTQEIPKGAFVFIGMRCDIGVTRNEGKKGAVDGPLGFRDAYGARALTMPLTDKTIVDAGDIYVVGDDLESAHRQYAKVIEHILQQGGVPIAIGGGYDMALPFYQAHTCAHPKESFALISMSPFANVRPLKNGEANSGTAIGQILTEVANIPSMVYGFQDEAGRNLIRHTDRLRRLASDIIPARKITSEKNKKRKKAWKRFTDFVDAQQHIVLTMELNVMSARDVPGVSATSSLGLSARQTMRAINYAARKGKLDGIVIAELAPNLDNPNKTTAENAANVAISFMDHYQAPRRGRKRNRR